LLPCFWSKEFMKTTLNEIRKHSPCGLTPREDGTREGLCKLLHYLGKTTTDDEQLSIRTILESNGLDDALWCLCAVSGYDREMRLLAVEFARQVQHLMPDPRSVAALDTAERFANGLATLNELSDARAAAWDAARDAAWDAAWAAAWDAAWAAAWDAARAAARDAAWAAAWDAARDAAWDAAWDAAQASQKAILLRVITECEARK
jgi:hypothetical protein